MSRFQLLHELVHIFCDHLQGCASVLSQLGDDGVYGQTSPKSLPDVSADRNQSLFDAYLQYCYSPKHTVGEQLLDVRRDKRERAAYAATEKRDGDSDDDDEEEDFDEQGEEDYDVDLGSIDGNAGDSDGRLK
jgi:hypothetical protein